MTKRFLGLFLLILIPMAFVQADPRFPLPRTPSQIWQNDLDLQDEMDYRIIRSTAGSCINDTTFCVDYSSGQVVITTGTLAFPGLVFDTARKTGLGSYSERAFSIIADSNLVAEFNVQQRILIFRNGNEDAPTIVRNTDIDTGYFFDTETLGFATAGSTVTLMHPDGYVTKPLQTCFLATISSNTSNVTGDGSQHTVEFDTEIKDYNNDFNTGTHKYTFPEAGLYYCSFVIHFSDGWTDQDNAQAQLVTSNRTYRQQKRTLTDYLPMEISTYVDADASDTAYVTVTMSGGSNGKDVEIADSGVSELNFFGCSLIN